MISLLLSTCYVLNGAKVVIKNNICKRYKRNPYKVKVFF
nr:MAG TPA: hypothetical protein [Crassvirales sp.]